MNRIVIGASAVVLVLLALWWSRRGEPGPGVVLAGESQPAAASPRSSLPPRLEAAPLSSPPARAAGSVHDRLDGFATWLAAAHASAGVSLFDVDCSAQPCLIAVTYDARSTSARELRALLPAVRNELERRLGYAITVTHADQDRDGRDYLWMYGLPADVATEQREALRRSAEARYALRMDPLRPRRNPARPDER